ncbi:hypothetical protein [Peribacillus butanolivorans]|uniref:hypothetical protein n=1 Tax=Peribacillus butanolivorans TaxID=421767 RepID=UPI0036C38216
MNINIKWNEKFGWYLDTQQLIRSFNNSDTEHLEITENLIEMQKAIIELIDERINIDIEAYESIEMWKCEDYFSLNNTLLKFEDFNNKVLTVEIDGELNPENEGTDLIDVIVHNDILNENIKGSIEVCYGYMYFDEEHRAADGMNEEVNFCLDEVIEAIQEVSQHLKHQIQQDKEIIRDTINKIGL